jgi:26S proteasome non-ATPase regulatory subunit 5
MEARYNCCVAINKALSSSHLLHEASLSGLIGKVDSRSLRAICHFCCFESKTLTSNTKRFLVQLNDAVKRGPYLSDRKRVEARPVVDTAERF